MIDPNHPPCWEDTGPEAYRVWIDLIRKKTADEKLRMVFEMIDFMQNMIENSIRKDHPEATEREVFLMAAARRLDRETMLRVYGWTGEEQRARGASA